MGLLILELLSLTLLSLLSAGQSNSDDSLRIAFLTDCTPYSAWQSVGMAFAFKQTQQPGAITRVMCCTDEERAQIDSVLLNVLPTHVAKSYTWNERLKDYYQAYNKPGALYDWLGNVTPEERWIMVVDSGNHNRSHSNTRNACFACTCCFLQLLLMLRGEVNLNTHAVGEHQQPHAHQFIHQFRAWDAHLQHVLACSLCAYNLHGMHQLG